jgi:MoaA/NifB/PqqE/SkfB family radical SAM enzyme
MHSHKGRFEPTRFEDLSVTVDFHCHSACRFCIVQEGMNYFRGVPFATFKEAVDRNKSAPRYRRVTFTGGEVTLEDALFDYLEYAKRSGSFEHVRLQTNGRLLADEAFAARLIAAGVDEFFISLHGESAATQDYITQRKGSFDEALRGIANVKLLGACLMTNTVLTTLNVPSLAAIVDTVRPFSPSRMEFWNYLPMEDYDDARALLAPMSELIPALCSALGRARDYGIATAVKYVPRCLLGEFGDAVDNTQPDVVIVEEFYDRYPKFACVHEARCEHSEACLGLHHPYITKYGWEEDRLRPTPRQRPWQEPEYGGWVVSDQTEGGGAEARPHPEWRALVEGVAEHHGGRLSEVLLQRRACVFRFALGESSVDVVLTARDTGVALAKSRSFDLHYRNVVGEAVPALGRLVTDAVRAVIERDGGALVLDQRKGLVGPDAVRGRASGAGAHRRSRA